MRRQHGYRRGVQSSLGILLLDGPHNSDYIHLLSVGHIQDVVARYTDHEDHEDQADHNVAAVAGTGVGPRAPRRAAQVGLLDPTMSAPGAPDVSRPRGLSPFPFPFPVVLAP